MSLVQPSCAFSSLLVEVVSQEQQQQRKRKKASVWNEEEMKPSFSFIIKAFLPCGKIPRGLKAHQI
jgi:hypothetical protein